MYCGEVASAAGVSADTVRHYERLGLLRTAQRSVAGYRLFPSDALNRVRLIQGALALGFSLKELAAILGERDRGGTPCRKVRKLAAKKLDELEVRLREMQRWRRELRGTLALWDRTLRKTRSGQRAGLLETFAATHPDRRTRRSERYVLPNGNDKREKRQ
jgi:DNA-binding transcriptional MerR regulator